MVFLKFQGKTCFIDPTEIEPYLHELGLQRFYGVSNGKVIEDFNNITEIAQV